MNALTPFFDIRDPILGGVRYYASETPGVCIAGHYAPHLFEVDCTCWEVLGEGMPEGVFPSFDAACAAAFPE